MKNHESVKKWVSATLSLAMLCSNTGTAGVTLLAYAEDAEGEPVLLEEEQQAEPEEEQPEEEQPDEEQPDEEPTVYEEPEAEPEPEQEEPGEEPQEEEPEEQEEPSEETPEQTEEPAPEPETTEAPTAEPTPEPEVTEVPTVEPTVEPEATEAPTAEPTAEPTPEPEATAEPTVEPTVEPTEEPVVEQEFANGYLRIDEDTVVYESASKAQKMGVIAADSVVYGEVCAKAEEFEDSWLRIAFDGGELIVGYIQAKTVTPISADEIGDTSEESPDYRGYILPYADFEAAEPEATAEPETSAEPQEEPEAAAEPTEEPEEEPEATTGPAAEPEEIEEPAEEPEESEEPISETTPEPEAATPEPTDTPEPTATPEPEIAEQDARPSVSGVWYDRTIEGEQTGVHVTTSLDAQTLTMYLGDEELASWDASEANIDEFASGKEWHVGYTFENSGDYYLWYKATSASGEESDAYAPAPAKIERPAIISAWYDRAFENQPAKLHITTNLDMQVLYLYQGDNLLKSYNASETDITEYATCKEWNIDYTFENSGNYYLWYKASKDGSELSDAYAPAPLTVERPAIIGVWYETGIEGKPLKIHVTTNLDMEHLYLYLGDDELGAWDASEADITEYATCKEWTIEHTFDEPGAYYLWYKASPDGVEMTPFGGDPVTISRPAIIGVWYEQGVEKEPLKIHVTTNLDMEHLYLYLGDDELAQWTASEADITEYATCKEWTVEHTFDEPGAYYLWYKASADGVEMTPYGGDPVTIQRPAIISVEYGKADVGEPLEIRITTKNEINHLYMYQGDSELAVWNRGDEGVTIEDYPSCDTWVVSYTFNYGGDIYLWYKSSVDGENMEKAFAADPVTIGEKTPLDLTMSYNVPGTWMKFGEEIRLNATAFGGVEPYTYSFGVYKGVDDEETLVEPVFGEDNTFAYTPETLGDYNIVVIVHDAANAEAGLDTGYIHVYQETITADKQEYKLGETITWTAAIESADIKYEWSVYCDGELKASETTDSPVFQYTTQETAGAYSVKLAATDRYVPRPVKLESGEVTVTARAEQAFEFEAIDDTTCRLKKYVGTDTVVVIPSEAPDGRKVVSIGTEAFYVTNVTNVTIPDTVTEIGKSAFSGCRKLVSVDIPDSVETIGSNAFVGCESLESIKIPSKVTKINEYTFHGCLNLSNVELPHGVKEIGLGAFQNCKSLTFVEIPDSITKISQSAFYKCSDLKEIKLSENLSEISQNAFGECTALTTIEIPDGVTKIGYIAFENCTSLTEVRIPNSVTEFGDGIFNNAPNVVIHCYSGSTAEEYAKDNGIDYVLLDEPMESDFVFEFVDDLLVVAGYTGTDTDLVIPGVWKIGEDIVDVYAIGENAFAGNTSITSVTIQNNTGAIYDGAFAGCTNLKTVNLPSKFGWIGPRAFEGCVSLTDIDFPADMMWIDGEAFAGCTGLTVVNLPKDIDWIGDGVFAGCSNLSRVVLPRKMNYIPYHAFADCTALHDIWIDENIEGIDRNAFEGCTDLTIHGRAETEAQWFAEEAGFAFEAIDAQDTFVYTELEDGTLSIARYNGTDYELTIHLKSDDGRAITRIGDGAFSGNSLLTRVTLNEGLTAIGADAFANCANLTGIRIPASVTSIGENAFEGCTNLTIYGKAGSAAQTYADANGIAFVADADLADFVFESNDSGGCTLVAYNGMDGDVVIPAANDAGDPVTEIGVNAFRGNEHIVSVTIPDTVWLVEFAAFKDCLNLESVNFAQTNLLHIDGHAFENCASLTSVELPDTLEIIENYAFAGCSSLTELVFPNKALEWVGGNAFEDCTSLASVELPDELVNFDNCVFTGCTSLTAVKLPANLTRIADGMFERCSSLTTVEIPENVTEIGSFAFGSCESLTSINIPVGVTDIGSGAFSGCSALMTVKLPDGLTRIESELFMDSGLTSLDIPDGVTEIGNHAFANCRNLTAIEIPDSVTEMGEDAFIDCENLAEVRLPNDLTVIAPWTFANTGLTHIDIPDSVTEIGESAFESCHELTSVKLSNSLKEIGYQVFAWSGLTSVEFPEGLTRIGPAAFRGNSELTRVVFPDTLEEIDSGAFVECGSLQSIRIPDSVNWIADDAFRGSYMTILCSKGSYAESWAKEHGYAFYTAGDAFQFEDGMLVGYTGSDAVVEIPEYMPDGNQPGGIGAYAFAGNTTITTVIMTGMMDTIQEGAFEGCTNLKTVRFSGRMKWIDPRAFANCTSLTDIEFTPELLKIDYEAFAGCTSLTSVVLPNEFCYLSDGAFAGCTSLNHVVLSKKIGGIPYRAFADCTALHEIWIDENIWIDDNAFEGCADLTIYGKAETEAQWFAERAGFTFVAVSAEDTFVYTELEDGTLSVARYNGMQGEATVHLKSDDGRAITKIGDGAFRGNQTLGKVTLNEGLTAIGAKAFENCANLVSIRIPASVTSIGANAFDGCTNLTIYGKAGSAAQAYAEANGIAFVADEETAEFVFAKNNDGGCMLVAYNGTDSDVVIPAQSPDGETVNQIGRNAFRGNEHLVSVSIPADVWEIGYAAFEDCVNLASINLMDAQLLTIQDFAFRNCTSLTRIDMPDSVSFIGNMAFKGCTSLKDLRLPNGEINYICSGVFAECTGLEEVYIPDNFLFTDSNMFENCTSLKSVRLPAGMTVLPSHTFNGCTSLTEFELPEGLMDIENNAFERCTSLTNIELPDGLTRIGGYAFYCSGLTHIEIPDGVTEIEDGAFDSCASLTHVKLPENLTRIGGYAFANCANLTEIELPESLTEIGDGAFEYSGLTHIEIPDSVTNIAFAAFRYCASLETAKLSSSLTELDYQVFWGSGLTSIEVPEGVTSIQDTFRECRNLTHVVLPDSLEEIGQAAFMDCSSLEEIELPKNLKTLTMHAFLWSGLTHIEIPDSMTEIGEGVFLCNEHLRSVVLPNGMTRIEKDMFNGCFELASVTLPDTLESIGENAFLWCGNLGSIRIPDSVTEIADNAFEEADPVISCSVGSYAESWAKEHGLRIYTSGEDFQFEGGVLVAYTGDDAIVEIPSWTPEGESVVEIGAKVFSGCSSLMDVTIPNGITKIGDYAFNGCKGLTTLDLPDSVTEIGRSAFVYSGLTEIKLPKVKTIGDSAFSSCDNLTEIELSEELTEIGKYMFFGSGLKSIKLPKNVEKIGAFAFSCPKFTEIELSENLKEIDERAFIGCRLKSIEIPEGVEKIGEYALYACRDLTSIIIPASVTEIGDCAFDNGASDVVIYCDEGSYAHQYAQDHGIKFELNHSENQDLNTER